MMIYIHEIGSCESIYKCLYILILQYLDILIYLPISLLVTQSMEEFICI